jgi:hypothetical protein
MLAGFCSTNLAQKSRLDISPTVKACQWASAFASADSLPSSAFIRGGAFGRLRMMAQEKILKTSQFKFAAEKIVGQKTVDLSLES